MLSDITNKFQFMKRLNCLFLFGKPAGRQHPICSKCNQISPGKMAVCSYKMSTFPVRRGVHSELMMTGLTDLNE
jgi:hypothetical protein